MGRLVADLLTAHSELPVRGGDRPQEVDLARFLRRCRRAEQGMATAPWSPERAALLDTLTRLARAITLRVTPELPTR